MLAVISVYKIIKNNFQESMFDEYVIPCIVCFLPSSFFLE